MVSEHGVLLHGEGATPLRISEINVITSHCEETMSAKSWVTWKRWTWTVVAVGSFLEWWGREWLIRRSHSSGLHVLPVVKEVEAGLQDVAAGVELREEMGGGGHNDDWWPLAVCIQVPARVGNFEIIRDKWANSDKCSFGRLTVTTWSANTSIFVSRIYVNVIDFVVD